MMVNALVLFSMMTFIAWAFVLLDWWGRKKERERRARWQKPL
jgi:hypothetical protein